MLQKLRRKFVWIAMGSLLLVMLVIVGSINWINISQMNQRADGLLNILSDNGGKFPDQLDMAEGGKPPKPNPGQHFQMNAETRFETRYFTVTADAVLNVTQIDTSHIAAVSSSEALAYGREVLQSGKASGYSGVYKYLVTDFKGGRLIVFVDCRNQLQMAGNFLLLSCGVAGVSLLAVLVLISFFSRKAFRPAVESMEKQRRFITDAGHEIKTPLAIISANAEVLEMTGGPSEWTQSIRNQTKRLDGLVQDLLALTRMEEEGVRQTFTIFSASEAVIDTASPFRAVAEARGKHFKLEVQPSLTLLGEETSFRRLVSILTDNAVKYADDGGFVTVLLSRSGKGLRLEVRNTCAKPPDGDLNRLFGRFYRADSSRSRETGGYGIGLSIAQAVVLAHKGKISAGWDAENGIRFIAVF